MIFFDVTSSLKMLDLQSNVYCPSSARHVATAMDSWPLFPNGGREEGH